MADKLPETIRLGHGAYQVELVRKQAANGHWLMEWACASNWNELRRNRQGRWLYSGTPLDRQWGTGITWCETPEAAFRACLEHQRKMLRQKFEMDLRKLDDALKM